MQGNWNHEEAYYRCRYPQEYALPETLEHPRVVYLREAHVIPPLDRWISTLFRAENVEVTCRALADAQEPNANDDARIAVARQLLSDCDARLARYREALESGVDPIVVGSWIDDVQAERRRAEDELRRRDQRSALTHEDIVALVESLGDIADVLEVGEPQKKVDLYETLGLSLTYQPRDRKVLVEADLSGVQMVGVGGGI
jgi:site-specific DNA recombinase